LEFPFWPWRERAIIKIMLIGITGANGFIGKAVVRHLVEEQSVGYSLRCLSRNVDIEKSARDTRVSWVRGDLGSPEDCRDFVKDCDVLIHLAQANNPISSERCWPSDAASNFITTLNLLQAVRETKKRPHIVFASSGGAVYGASGGRVPLRETDACSPVSAYGIQKLAAENYLQLAALQGCLTASVLRISNPYGELLPPERRQGLIGVALNQSLNGRVLQVFGDDSIVRDYIHLDDLTRAVGLVLKPSKAFAIYNIGSGVGHSVRQIIEIIGAAGGRPLATETIMYGKETVAMNPWIVLDMVLAKKEIGWEPRISLEEGIGRMVLESKKKGGG